jgi:hypothetical protein
MGVVVVVIDAACSVAEFCAHGKWIATELRRRRKIK